MLIAYMSLIEIIPWQGVMVCTSVYQHVGPYLLLCLRHLLLGFQNLCFSTMPVIRGSLSVNFINILCLHFRTKVLFCQNVTWKKLPKRLLNKKVPQKTLMKLSQKWLLYCFVDCKLTYHKRWYSRWLKIYEQLLHWYSFNKIL